MRRAVIGSLFLPLCAVTETINPVVFNAVYCIQWQESINHFTHDLCLTPTETSNRKKIGNTQGFSRGPYLPSHPQMGSVSDYHLILYTELFEAQAMQLVTSWSHCDTYNFYMSLTKWQPKRYAPCAARLWMCKRFDHFVSAGYNVTFDRIHLTIHCGTFLTTETSCVQRVLRLWDETLNKLPSLHI